MQVSASQAFVAPQLTRVSGAVAPMTVSDANAALTANAALPTPKKLKIEIQDTAENISLKFNDLKDMGTALTKITVSNPSTVINLTADQFTTGSKTLANIKSNYSLKVTNVSMDKLNAVTGNVRVLKVQVNDSSANIGSKFSNLLNQPNKIDKIIITDSNPISMSGDLFSRGTTQPLLTKIESNGGLGNYTLDLKDVKVADLAGANANSKVLHVTVKDTSANISANLAGVTPSLVGNNVTSIIQSDANNSIAITDTKFQALASTLAKLAGASSLAVTGVTAARVATVAADARVKSVSVTDTAARIEAKHLEITVATKISSITVEDTSSNLSLNFGNISTLKNITKIKLTDTANILITGAQLKNNAPIMALLSKVYDSNDVKGNFHVTATAVSAADVNATAKLTMVDKIRVQDTVNNAFAKLTPLNTSKVEKMDLTVDNAKIDGQTRSGGFQISGANLDKLDAFGVKLTSVTSTGGDIAISYNQYIKSSATLAKIETTGGKLIVSDAGASAASVLTADTNVKNFTVKDSAVKIASNFSDLKLANPGNKLTQVQLTDNGTIKLNAAQYTGASENALLGVVKDVNGQDNFKLEVNGVTAATLVALAGSDYFDNVTKVSIQDTSNYISANLYDLGEAFAASKLGDITLFGAPADIEITKGQLDDTKIAGALGKITGQNYTLDVSAVSAAGASALISGNAKVAKLSVEDTSAHITSKLADLAAITPSKLTAISVTDHATEEITIASSLLTSYSGILGKMDDYQLNVTDVSASDAKSLTLDNDKISHLTVQDKGNKIASNWANLKELDDKLTSISFIGSNNLLNLTNSQYGESDLLAKFAQEDYTLAISGATFQDATNSSSGLNVDIHVVSYSVEGDGAVIVSNLADLKDNEKLQGIAWRDTTVDMVLTGTQYTENKVTLSKINSGHYAAKVNDLSAADTIAAEFDANITEFSVKDSAANLGANMVALNTSATKPTPKIQKIELDDPTDNVAMTIDIYENTIDARLMMGSGSNPIQMAVSGVSVVDAAAFLADQDNLNVANISVSGLAVDIVRKLSDLQTNKDKITAITVTGVDKLLVLAASDYNDNQGALDILSESDIDGYQATVSGLAGNKVAVATGDSNVVSFTVADNASGLGTNFADMVNAGAKLTSITQSDAGTAAVSISLSDLKDDAVNYANTLNKFAAPPAVTLTA